MSQMTLTERVAALERQVAELQAALAKAFPAKDWQRTVGMFTGDEVMQQILAEGRKIRQADRDKARRGGGRKKLAKS